MEELTFLVVDDDGMVRNILVEYLKGFGYKKIIEAKNGAEALKIIRDTRVRIDIIISDWEMPKINGLTLLKAIRRDAHRSSVKFVMVSSQASRERQKITKAMEASVDAYLIKPFRAHALKEKIDLLVSQISPVDAKLVIEFVNSYLRVGWYNKAVNLCKTGLEKFPDNTDLLLLAARAHYLNSQLDEATEILDNLLKIKPNHLDAQKLLTQVRDDKNKTLRRVG